MENIKKLEQEKINALISTCGVFFAFSNDQFNENKTPLKEGEKYVSLGAGAYIPKGNVQSYIDGLKSIGNWRKKEVKKLKDGKEKEILFQLDNYECFYTHDIDDAARVLPYSKKEIWKVFQKYESQIKQA